VDLLSVIRRWHSRDKLSIREIARRTGLSRNTIKKYLSSGEVSPKYPARKSVSKLDPYAETLASWLKRESKRSRKRRRNLKQLHRDLVALGFDGSYDRVAAFARDWRQRERERTNRASKGAFVPLAFEPGEAFQFDWSEDWLRIGKKKIKLQIAHFKLCHSRAFFLRAYLTQTHEMLFDAHNHAFRVLGGIPERGIYDNMKTAVDKVGRGKKRLQRVLMKREGGDREMADILALVLHHDEKLVEKAVREAIESDVVSKTHIINRLSRLLDAPPPAALEPPPALTLREDPVANTKRYDNLRGISHVR
jgi:transposase